MPKNSLFFKGKGEGAPLWPFFFFVGLLDPLMSFVIAKE